MTQTDGTGALAVVPPKQQEIITEEFVNSSLNQIRELLEGLADVSDPLTRVRLATDAKARSKFLEEATHEVGLQKQIVQACTAHWCDAKRARGLALSAMPKHTGAMGTGSNQHEVRLHDVSTPTYDDLNISYRDAHQEQIVAKLPDHKYETFKEEKLQEEALSWMAVFRYTENVLKIGSLTSSEHNEWYTPFKYIDAARAVMGGIDLDPASSAKANETVKARVFYDEETNGLEHEWLKRVWLNPPYGGHSAKFVAYLLDQIEQGNTEEAIVLVNANSTETGWFAPLWDYTLCFADHRINFYSPKGSDNGSTHGSVFIYIGPNEDRFIRNFKQFGPVVKRVDDAYT